MLLSNEEKNTNLNSCPEIVSWDDTGADTAIHILPHYPEYRKKWFFRPIFSLICIPRAC